MFNHLIIGGIEMIISVYLEGMLCKIYVLVFSRLRTCENLKEVLFKRLLLTELIIE